MPTYYPPTCFHFKVEFVGVSGTDTDTEQRFQEVSGLSFEVETEELREGGENRFVYKLPKRAKYPNLVLKRGLLKGTALLDWFKSAMSTYFTVVIYDFKPADLVITLLDEADQAVAIWNVVQAYPLKWATSDLKASENGIVIETLELAYQYFERKM
ncbi:phage tail-like protein [Chitinophaga niastensis]|uniref:Phage tail-like protein n=1 Tax=Chitinophaga niastensis TaxID=536980 RepID=A0A2P8HEY6_CHINA|nr:phage tail protein [Chitinophaga niastensis]PSL44792.1 phage tail-like protein [Chitinophaga niastensis]